MKMHAFKTEGGGKPTTEAAWDEGNPPKRMRGADSESHNGSG